MIEGTPRLAIWQAHQLERLVPSELLGALPRRLSPSVQVARRCRHRAAALSARSRVVPIVKLALGTARLVGIIGRELVLVVKVGREC